jgi:predicted acetyltransferase
MNKLEETTNWGIYFVKKLPENYEALTQWKLISPALLGQHWVDFL